VAGIFAEGNDEGVIFVVNGGYLCESKLILHFYKSLIINPEDTEYQFK
jgi:hypothetical protein